MAPGMPDPQPIRAISAASRAGAIPRLNAMPRKRLATWRIERQLRSVVSDLAAARQRAVIAREQYEAVRDDDEDAQMRSLGSDMVEDRHVADQTRRHAEVMHQELERADHLVVALERERDALLARYEPSS
jgi:hypothetical protein